MPNKAVEVKVNLVPPSILFGKTAAASGDIIREVVNTAQEYAKKQSPFKHGHNRSSITWDEQARANEVPGFRIYTQSGYGGYLELGTKRMAARPYIKPSIERAMQESESRNRA